MPVRRWTRARGLRDFGLLQMTTRAHRRGPFDPEIIATAPDPTAPVSSSRSRFTLDDGSNGCPVHPAGRRTDTGQVDWGQPEGGRE